MKKPILLFEYVFYVSISYSVEKDMTALKENSLWLDFRSVGEQRLGVSRVKPIE